MFRGYIQFGATEFTESTEDAEKRNKMAVNSFADKLVKKIFGSSSDIFLKNTRPVVEKINALEPSIEKLSDDELKAQTPKFKERIKNALAEFDKSPEGHEAEAPDMTNS